MFRFCLLFTGAAFLEKLDTILRQKITHFKTKNFHFNWTAHTILHLKVSADIVPLLSLPNCIPEIYIQRHLTTES